MRRARSAGVPLLVAGSVRSAVLDRAQRPWLDARVLLLPAAALLATALPTSQPEIEVLYYGPRCLSRGDTSINLLSMFFGYFSREKGESYVASSGFSALADGPQIFMPEGSLADARVVSRYLEGLGGQAPKRVVVEEEVPVLVSPFEVVLQLPYRGHRDFLKVLEQEAHSQSFGLDFARTTARVTRLENQNGDRVLALTLDDPEGLMGARASAQSSTAAAAGLLRMTREFGVESRVSTPDDKVMIYSLGRQLARGPRIVKELERLGAQGQAPALLLHPGGVAQSEEGPAELELCGRSLAGLGVTAIVPRSEELQLGERGLAEFKAAHNLPFIAANLMAGGKRLFPRYVKKTVQGLEVAVIGVVAREELDGLLGNIRSEWQISDPRMAVTDTLQAIRGELHRFPDLTIVLVGGADFADVPPHRLRNVDIMLGSFRGADLLPKQERVGLLDGARSRELTRSPLPILAPVGNYNAVGRIVARFSRSDEPSLVPFQLTEVEHQVVPVEEPGPIDERLWAEIRALEEQGIARASEAILPDISKMVEAHPELHPLVFGDHVAYQDGYRSYQRPAPGRFSDFLWMRLVTNILREDLAADVALVRVLKRTYDMIGPLTRSFADNWLARNDLVRLVHLSGQDLLAIAARLEQQVSLTDARPSTLLFAAGIDWKRKIIAGRPINPKVTYLVATTDDVMALPELGAVFQDKPYFGIFSRQEDGVYLSDEAGAPLLLRTVVTERFDSWLDPTSGAFQMSHEGALEDTLLDQSDRQRGEWSLSFDGISVSGARYANTSNVGVFKATRETRVTTPGNYSLSVTGTLGLLYEGPALAWETRARALLQRVVILVDGQEVASQEGGDDLVFSTELRLNAVQLQLGADKVPLVPFIQEAFDTEFTATPDPSRGPESTFPHQKLARTSLGLVAYPGPRLREVRFGGVFQLDASEASLHKDFGLTVGYKSAWPIAGPVTFTSDLDLRYLLADPDDRASDLSLFASIVNRLMVRVIGDLSVFAFADVALVRGKVDSDDEVGGSFIAGGGLSFDRILRL